MINDWNILLKRFGWSLFFTLVTGKVDRVATMPFFCNGIIFCKVLRKTYRLSLRLYLIRQYCCRVLKCLSNGFVRRFFPVENIFIVFDQNFIPSIRNCAWGDKQILTWSFIVCRFFFWRREFTLSYWQQHRRFYKELFWERSKNKQHWSKKQ